MRCSAAHASPRMQPGSPWRAAARLSLGALPCARACSQVTLVRRIYKLWSDIFDRIEAQPFPEDSDSSLAAGIRRLQASKEGQAFSRKDLQHTAIGLLIAGLDSQALTTSFTLCAPSLAPCSSLCAWAHGRVGRAVLAGCAQRLTWGTCAAHLHGCSRCMHALRASLAKRRGQARTPGTALQAGASAQRGCPPSRGAQAGRTCCAHACGACSMCLAAHPEKQARLAHELRQHGLLATPENPDPRAVTADDLPKLVYTDAVRCLLAHRPADLPARCLAAKRHCTAPQHQHAPATSSGVTVWVAAAGPGTPAPGYTCAPNRASPGYPGSRGEAGLGAGDQGVHAHCSSHR